jgi:hypothetical protein
LLLLLKKKCVVYFYAVSVKKNCAKLMFGAVFNTKNPKKNVQNVQNRCLALFLTPKNPKK